MFIGPFEVINCKEHLHLMKTSKMSGEVDVAGDVISHLKVDNWDNYSSNPIPSFNTNHISDHHFGQQQ